MIYFGHFRLRSAPKIAAETEQRKVYVILTKETEGLLHQIEQALVNSVKRSGLKTGQRGPITAVNKKLTTTQNVGFHVHGKDLYDTTHRSIFRL